MNYRGYWEVSSGKYPTYNPASIRQGKYNGVPLALWPRFRTGAFSFQPADTVPAAGCLYQPLQLANCMGEANRAGSSLDCGAAVAALSGLPALSTDKMDGKQADSAIKNLAMATSSLLPDVITERTLLSSLPIVYLILKYFSTIISLYTAR